MCWLTVEVWSMYMYDVASCSNIQIPMQILCAILCKHAKVSKIFTQFTGFTWSWWEIFYPHAALNSHFKPLSIVKCTVVDWYRQVLSLFLNLSGFCGTLAWMVLYGTLALYRHSITVDCYVCEEHKYLCSAYCFKWNGIRVKRMLSFAWLYAEVRNRFLD